MTDGQPTQQAGQPQPIPSDAWRDVGKQFEALGQSLATAIRTAWESEENRKRAQSMKTGLESMVNEIGQAIKDTADSPQGQKARSEAEKAAQSLRSAGRQTWEDARPHLVSALHQVSAELQKMISQLEQEGAKPTVEETPDKQTTE
jgi:hypothetical protein